jgi:hypothetical protein
MRIQTLQEIKDFFPEGCEIICAVNHKNKSLVYYYTLDCDLKGNFRFINKKGQLIFVYSNRRGFAKIINTVKKNETFTVF